MIFYNTMSRKKEEFIPLDKKQVKFYACGPTVYNYASIGNLRAYIFEDLLRRVLEHAGYEVIHAMNITDVGHLVGDGDEGEDKLEVGAKRENQHPLEIAKRYEAAFFEDMKQVNVGIPQKVLRATDSIDKQIEIIKILEDKGFAYKGEKAIYFDTSKLDDYGKLTGQKLEDKQTGAREEVVLDKDKRNPQDFALWFFLVGKYQNHILHWPSPWGEGFPGWHIECSAISRTLLGQPFDIHAGGVDHIGTHHTNEIAQSEAAFGVPLANYWVHNEFLMVDGQKMSKSLNNVYTLKDVKEKGFRPEDFRYFILSGHYRSKLNFTWKGLEAAKNARERLNRVIDGATEEGKASEEYLSKFDQRIFDDLDTPGALAVLWEMIRDSQLSQSDKAATFSNMNEVLGLDSKAGDQAPENIVKLAEERTKAREAKDFGLSDQLREKIADLGWTIEDLPGNKYKIVKL